MVPILVKKCKVGKKNVNGRWTHYRNKRVHTMWKSIKKCAIKLYKKLCAFLIEATCADGKMWIEYVKSRYKIVIFGLLVFCSWLYVFFSWGVWWLRGPRHNWLFPMRKRHFCILRFCSHSISTPHFFSGSFWMLPPLLPLICKRRILTYRPPPFSQAFFTPGVNIGQMATKIRLFLLFLRKSSWRFVRHWLHLQSTQATPPIDSLACPCSEFLLV